MYGVNNALIRDWAPCSFHKAGVEKGLLHCASWHMLRVRIWSRDTTEAVKH